MEQKPIVTAELAAPLKPQMGSSRKAIASFVLGVLSFFCALFTGIIAITLGALALADISKSQGRLQGSGFAIAGIVMGAIGCFWTLILIALLLPAVQQAREAVRRTTTVKNIRQLTLGMLNYEAVHKRLPPPIVGDGLSWRVHILPFLEENELYNEFHLDEPWDSPHNLKLVGRMPIYYQNPNLMLGPGKTTYVIPTSPAIEGSSIHAAFVQGQPAPHIRDFIDGTKNTILILEADEDAAVTWTDPKGDWLYDPNDPMRSLGNVRPGIIVAGMVDGTSRLINKRTSARDLNALITRNGLEDPVR